MQTLIQNQTLVNTETEATRIQAQMVQCLTTYYLRVIEQFPTLNRWEDLYRVWAETWSDDRGIDITRFPVPCDPAVTVNEDAFLWQISVATGINQF